MKKVKRKNLYGEKISRERTNEYKLGKYVKQEGAELCQAQPAKHKLLGPIELFFCMNC